jgi:hypothetical protein
MRAMGRKAFGVGIVLSTLGAGLAVPAFATTDYTNMFAGVQTELTTALTAIVPGVVVVFAILAAIRLGFALYRRIAKG